MINGSYNFCKVKYLPDGYEPIINYYNQHKSKDFKNLEKIDCDENNKIYQLRWSSGRLLSNGYYGFTTEQLELLYESLVSCIGKENVYFLGEKK